MIDLALALGVMTASGFAGYGLVRWIRHMTS